MRYCPMKKLIDFSLNNKFAVWILTVMVICIGLFSGLNMKQEMMPDIQFPSISVVTSYPGATPDEVMNDVTVPIEQRIQNLKGVTLVNSSSMANASSVQIGFDFDTDMDVATNEVKEALADISLPESSNSPQVSRLSFDAFPVMSVSISNANATLEQLTSTIEREVIPALEGINGVAKIQMSGQQLNEVAIRFDEDKMAQYGLNDEKIQQTIQGSNITFPLGLTDFGGTIKNVVIDGDIETVEDLKDLELPITPQSPAGMDTGQFGSVPEQQDDVLERSRSAQETTTEQNGDTEVTTVKLSEIADVEVVNKVESISRTNGEESIGIQVVKAPEANTVEVVNVVKEAFADFEKELGFTAITTMDQAEPIEESVSAMLDKALFGIIFAVIIILLFLRNVRTTFISIVSIPLSILIALFLLWQMDVSLNVMTLGALTVAVGRVIDDSIVVMENIYRRMHLPGEKRRGKELIREATREMFIPIFSSTIVTIAVFLPLGIVKGMVGEMFLPFALAVVFALAASLLVAVTIVPILSHSLFKKNVEGINRQKKDKKGTGKLASLYQKVLDWALNHKLIAFGSATVILILSLFLIPSIGVSFLPGDEQSTVTATYSPEPGQTQEEVEEVVQQAEEFLSGYDGIALYQYSFGGRTPSGPMMGVGDDHSAQFFIQFDEDVDISKDSITVMEALNENTERGEWGSVDQFASMTGGGIEVYVYGESITDIQRAVDDVLPVMEGHEGLEKVESSLAEAYDQYTLIPDQKKLSQYGLTTAQIGTILSQGKETPILTTVKHEGETIDVFIEIEEKTYNSIEDLQEMELQTPLGTSIAVSDVVTVQEGKSPETMTRRDGKMHASLTADVVSRDESGVSNRLENKLDEMELPEGVSIQFGGVSEQITESFTQLGLAMVAAIAIVYFILVITFGGALTPFTILFSLPFTIIGSLVGLWIAKVPLDVSAMIGALMLIGIVVTNAIVLIDRVIRNEKQGLSTREALLEAGSTRLRPILMTALATIGALLPLAISSENGGFISQGLGVTVIGGLTSSTLLTLVIVPIVYEFFARMRKKEYR